MNKTIIHENSRNITNYLSVRTTYTNHTYLVEQELSYNFVDYCTYPMSILSIVWNLIVIISSGLILKTDVQPRTTHIFLGNMALADLLHGIIFLIVFQFIPKIKQDLVCAFLLGLAACYVIECSLSVCLIAVDRYVFIHHGLQYNRLISTKRARYMVLATWIFSFIVGFIPEFLFADYSSPDLACTYFGMTTTYLMILGSITGLIPNVLTIILYSFIFYTATKVKKNIFKFNQKENSKSDSTLEDKIYTTSKIFSITTLPGNDLTNASPIKNTTQKQLNQIKNNNNNNNNIGTDAQINPNIANLTTCKHPVENYFGNNKPNLYKRIKEYIHQQGDNNNKNVYSKMYKNSSKGLFKSKSIMIVLSVTSTFTLAWGPCFVCILLYPILCNDVDLDTPSICLNLEDILYFIAFNLGLLNALMNPIIYCWWHKGFRKALIKLCFKKAVREKRRNNFIAALKKQETIKKENDNNNLGHLFL